MVAWFADKRFHVGKSKITLPESEREVLIYTYFDDLHADAWKKATDYVGRAVLFYSENVGEYPYNVAQAVDGSLEVEGAGGMEYPTITVLTGKYDQKSLDNVITHEVGHNWFYGILGSNEREHAWMDEGINTYYENRYMETYYGRDDFFGIPKRLAAYFGSDTTSADDILWTLTHTLDVENASQPINLPADDYATLNYGIYVYAQTGYFLRYLSDVMGMDNFDRVMHKYFNTFAFRHVYPVDMQKLFEEETGESFAWFFNDLINSSRGPDYKITHFQKGKTAMAIEVKNNSDIAAPFSVSILNGDSVVHTDFYRGFTGMNTIYLQYKPEWHMTHVRIDAGQYIPETNRENNTVKTDGIFKRLEPLELNWMFGTDNQHRTTIYYTPLVGWNNNDRWMFGLGLWNSTLPAPRWEYVLAPMYAPTTDRFVGQGSLGLNLYPEDGAFKRIRISEHFKSYTAQLVSVPEDDGTQLVSNIFRQYVGAAQFEMRPKYMNRKVSQEFSFRNIITQAESALPADVGFGYAYSTETEIYNELRYTLQNKRVLFPYGLMVRTQQSDDFIKLDAAVSYKLHYPKTTKGVNLRLFAGTFILKDDALSSVYDYVLTGTTSGYDYTYDAMYLGRYAPYGNFLSRQIIDDNGYFKVPIPTSGINNSDSYIAALNITAEIPVVPLALFADIGYNPSVDPDFSNVQYDAGVMVKFPFDLFDLYIPLLMSKDLANQFDDSVSFGQKISFRLNMNNLNLFEAARKLHF
ncbi:MAG: M1 family aminopeptidase [Chitinophagales bacterium]